MAERIDIHTPLRKELEDARREVVYAEREAKTQTENLDRSLGAIEKALEDGLAVPSSVSGGPFVSTDADRLSEALIARERAHRKVVEVGHLIQAFGLTVEEVETS